MSFKVGQEILVESLAYVSLSDMATPMTVKFIHDDHLFVTFGLGENFCETIDLKGNRIVAKDMIDFCQLLEIRIAKELDGAEAEIQRKTTQLKVLKEYRRNLKCEQSSASRA